MRSTIGRALLCLSTAVALSLPAVAQDWVGRGRGHGQVIDEQGEPIEGAEVTLHLPDRPDAGPDPETTDKRGRWAFGGLTGGTWVVVIEKEGYITSQGTFAVNEFQAVAPLQVELERNPYAGVQVGQDLIDQGRYAEARDEFQKVLPDMDEQQQAQLRALIGTTHFEEQDYQAAADAYEEALKGLSPEERTSVQLRLGDAYLQMESYDEARATYESALEGLEADGRRQVLVAIARSYDMEGDRERAVETFERILADDPENVQALQLAADLLSREGREEEAQEYLDRIPEEQELPADMLLNQGIRFYNEQKLDQALSNFDRVLGQDPEMADAYYYRGLVYLNKGENAQARADFEKLLELDPGSQYASDTEQFLQYLEEQ